MISPLTLIISHAAPLMLSLRAMPALRCRRALFIIALLLICADAFCCRAMLDTTPLTLMLIFSRCYAAATMRCIYGYHTVTVAADASMLLRSRAP